MASILIVLSTLVLGCASSKEKSKLETLLDYEGKYEYINSTSLELRVSELDTTLYAIIDDTKYPLKYITLDSFSDIQGNMILFERNKLNDVVSYKSNEQTFKLITSAVGETEMLPRKELFHNPDDYNYQQPIENNDGLKTGHLEDEIQKSHLIIDMVRKTIKGEYPEIHSILIYKNNKLILEEYFYGYDKDTPHQLRSATKPIIGGVLGIAIDKGFIKSEKDKLLPYFKTRYPEIANFDYRKKEITIENFLMYRHGLDCENNNPKSKGNELSMMESADWVKFTLDLPMIRKSGISSSYCTGCPLTLGSLVEIATNNNIEDFAKKNLFEPLDITNYDWRFEPNKRSMTNFSQLKLTPRDLVKLAKLYKDGGRWKGKQIISEEWIEKTFDMEEGDYGYLWYEKYFEVNGKKYNSFQASGNGGQKINIWPELDMITVFTGGNYNSYQLKGKSTPPNEMIPNYILKSAQ